MYGLGPCQLARLSEIFCAKPDFLPQKEDFWSDRGGSTSRPGLERGNAVEDLGVAQREVAGGDVAALLGLERGLLASADLLALRAAGVETARRRRAGGTRHVAAQVPAPALVRGVRDGHRRQERAGVRMARGRAEGVGVG